MRNPMTRLVVMYTAVSLLGAVIAFTATGTGFATSLLLLLAAVTTTSAGVAGLYVLRQCLNRVFISAAAIESLHVAAVAGFSAVFNALMTALFTDPSFRIVFAAAAMLSGVVAVIATTATGWAAFAVFEAEEGTA